MDASPNQIWKIKDKSALVLHESHHMIAIVEIAKEFDLIGQERFIVRALNTEGKVFVISSITLDCHYELMES